MGIIRYLNKENKTFYGVIQDNNLVNRIEGNIYEDYVETQQKDEIIKILAPIIPKDIFCIGLNYKKHAEESNAKIPDYPVVFMKNTGSVNNPGDSIRIPKKLSSSKVDYECELAVVIKKECYNVSRDKAYEYVLGYTCANDVSARDWQGEFGGGQWVRGKTFATFCPIGPSIITHEEIVDPHNLKIKTILNQEEMQNWNTNDMIFDIPHLIEFLSGSTVLRPGTLILTGTPHGVGAARNPQVFLKEGDKVTVEIEKIGSLQNEVVNEVNE